MHLATLLLCAAAATLAACAEEGHYPLSGETCRPDDPVLQMNGCDFAVIGFMPAPRPRPAGLLDASAFAGPAP